MSVWSHSDSIELLPTARRLKKQTNLRQNTPKWRTNGSKNNKPSSSRSDPIFWMHIYLRTSKLEVDPPVGVEKKKGTSIRKFK